MAKEKGLGLLRNLAFQPEYREDGGKTNPIEIGRFKHFGAVSRRRNGSILTANLMFIITMLPMLAIFVVVTAFGGVEQLAYKLKDIAETPYLLTAAGFGLSTSAVTPLDIRLYMLNVYYLIFLAVGVACIFMCIGLSGMMPLCMKFIIDDSFVSKKDNYGNDVPRAIVEFGKGVKRYLPQMLIVGAMFFVLFAGIANVYVYFIGQYWSGTANAGHWIMVILASIVALFTLMFLLHLIPTVVLYDMPFGQKMKNSAILTLQFFLQNLAIVAVFSIPFIIIGVTSMFIGAIVIAVLLVYGSKYYCLVMCNFEQYISEKIIQPVYNARYAKAKPVKNKKSAKK